MKTLVLNYHIIDNGKRDIPDLEHIYAVTEDMFVQQMELLHRRNIPVVPVADLLSGKELPAHAVAITFDDGNPSDFDVAAPVLKRFGFTATFFISLHNLRRNFFAWKDVKQLAADGFGIGAHGISHSDLTELSKAEQLYELKYSRQMIQANTGAQVDLFALPYGMYNRALAGLAKAEGYRALLSTDFRLNDSCAHNFIINRWALKRSTTLQEFEQVVSLQPAEIRKKFYLSRLRKSAMKLFGSNLTNRLNVLFQYILP